jgi:hypothetical protein
LLLVALALVVVALALVVVALVVVVVVVVVALIVVVLFCAGCAGTGKEKKKKNIFTSRYRVIFFCPSISV